VARPITRCGPAPSYRHQQRSDTSKAFRRAGQHPNNSKLTALGTWQTLKTRLPAVAGMQTPRLRVLQVGALPLLCVRRYPGILSAPTRRTLSGAPAASQEPQSGLTTPVPNDAPEIKSKSPFYFEAGYALFAKRPSRPFPPPFLSYPSGSFSDPLSTHHRSRDRRPTVNGEMIRGVTNGDDAVLVSDYFIGANDGVGAWATREKGHAA
jgi:hypothetical protein